LALFDDPVEEATEDSDTLPVADLAQAGVVRERLMQVVAQEPSQAKTIRSDLHEMTLGPKTFKQHDELELEKDDGIDGRPSATGIAVSHQVSDKAQVKHAFDLAIEMVLWDKLLKRDVLQRLE
jgi:hypothetical protein